MVHLKLSPSETTMLTDVLECTIAELRTEIARTDSHSFKEKLRQKRMVIERVIDQLRMAAVPFL